MLFNFRFCSSKGAVGGLTPEMTLVARSFLTCNPERGVGVYFLIRG